MAVSGQKECGVGTGVCAEWQRLKCTQAPAQQTHNQVGERRRRHTSTWAHVVAAIHRVAATRGCLQPREGGSSAGGQHTRARSVAEGGDHRQHLQGAATEGGVWVTPRVDTRQACRNPNCYMRMYLSVCAAAIVFG